MYNQALLTKRPTNILQIIICNFLEYTYNQALVFQETKYHITNNHLLVSMLDCMFIITNNYNLWIIINKKIHILNIASPK